jgi:hypothetical protein
VIIVAPWFSTDLQYFSLAGTDGNLEHGTVSLKKESVLFSRRMSKRKGTRDHEAVIFHGLIPK